MSAGASVVLLGSHDDGTHAVYHALADRFDLRRVIVEDPVPRSVFLRRRLARLGLRKVAGQMAFIAVVAPALRRRSRGRVAAIDRQYSIDRSPIPPALVTAVPSVNDAGTIALLRELSPAVIVIYGTRILSKELLASVRCPVINMHAGITPLYRGVHGAYWALRERDREHCGVTIHAVDAGIDTGGILYQATVAPTAEDNYATYPVLQLGAGLGLLARAVDDALRGELRFGPAPAGRSRLWTHPTLGEYVWHRLRYDVR